ncbi:TPA: hypothetical protein VDU83_002649 [Pseudomonas aeruginosa]|nr:hypothetical protein [Pseudomonas aeruginosa]
MHHTINPNDLRPERLALIRKEIADLRHLGGEKAAIAYGRICGRLSELDALGVLEFAELPAFELEATKAFRASSGG